MVRIWSASGGGTDNVVYYLLASAVFRDGLAGVFTFGAVLGVSVYGISAADVLLFGISANVVAAVGAVLGGLLDDRVGSKTVILGSLAAMIVVGLTLMALSGVVAFWVCGLLLCLFIGPTQSSARTLLLRMTADGKEGVAFGLYTMTGRAVAPLAPFMFSTFVAVFGADRAGIGGRTAGAGGRFHRDACRAGAPPGGGASSASRCRSSGLRRCAAAPAHR